MNPIKNPLCNCRSVAPNAAPCASRPGTRTIRAAPAGPRPRRRGAGARAAGVPKKAATASGFWRFCLGFHMGVGNNSDVYISI